MNPELILIKIITLLIREHEINSNTEKEDDLIHNVLDKIKLPNRGDIVSIDGRSDVLHDLMDLVYTLMNKEVDTGSKEDLLQTIKAACGIHQDLYESIREGVLADITQEEVSRQIASIRLYLKARLKEIEVKDIISKAYRDIIIDKTGAVSNKVINLINRLEELSFETDRDPAIKGSLSIDDINSIKGTLIETKEFHSDKGLMKTGWQGLNEMLSGGFRRGECVVVPGLQHNYKTGMNLSLFRQLAIYNKPYMLDNTKKPMLLRISFEDDLTNNIAFLYNSITGKNINELETEEDFLRASELIREDLGRNGYAVQMMRVDPTEWSYRDIINTTVIYFFSRIIDKSVKD